MWHMPMSLKYMSRDMTPVREDFAQLYFTGFLFALDLQSILLERTIDRTVQAICERTWLNTDGIHEKRKYASARSFCPSILTFDVLHHPITSDNIEHRRRATAT